MDVQYDRLALAVNRLRRPDLPASLDAIRRHTRADHLLALPDDADLATHDEAGQPLQALSPKNELICRIDAFLAELSL